MSAELTRVGAVFPALRATLPGSGAQNPDEKKALSFDGAFPKPMVFVPRCLEDQNPLVGTIGLEPTTPTMSR